MKKTAALVIAALLPIAAHAAFLLVNGGRGTAAGGGEPGTQLMTFTLDDSSTGADRPVSLGVPIGAGVLDSGQGLIVTTSDDTPLATQWNELATWRTDGSVLHGVLTFLTPSAGDNSGTYKVVTGTPETGTAVSKAEILSAGFDAVVTVVVSGTTYSLSAADLLDGTVATEKDDPANNGEPYPHLTGPLMSELVVGGHLLTDGTGTAHESLQAYFALRAFKVDSAVDKVYASIVLENTGSFVDISDVEASTVTVTVGATTVKSKTDFHIGTDYRFPVRAWWNTDPELFVAFDTDYLQATKLWSKYREMTFTGAPYDRPESTDWFERNVVTSQSIGAAGERPELGMYNSYEVAWLVAQTPEAWNVMRAFNDEIHWTSRGLTGGGAGVFAQHVRDGAWPLDMEANPTAVHIDRGYSPGAGVLEATADSTHVINSDLAHWPSHCYSSYLVTGEFNELEELQFSGVFPWIGDLPGAPGGNRTWPRPFFSGELRAVAWGFRNILDAAVATPDDHPLHDVLDDAVGYALDSFNEDARPLDVGDTLGLWLTAWGAVAYVDSQTPHPTDVSGASLSGEATGIARWQDDWMTWGILSAYERGWSAELELSGLHEWKAQAVVDRFGTSFGSSYCWDKAGAFALAVRDDGVTPSAYYATMEDVFEANYPGATSCATTPGGTMESDGNATTYTAQVAPALSMAVNIGIEGAAAAWAIYEARTRAWDPIAPESTSDYEDAAKWQMEPRP